MSPEEFEELFRLYVRANCEPGLSPKEAVLAQKAFAKALQDIWNTEKLPFPFIFLDFRQTVLKRILRRLRETDPRFRRPKF